MTTGMSVTEKYHQLQQKQQAQFQKPSEEPQGQEHYEDVDHIINTVIEEIWDEFDDDGNGTLDVDETHLFVKSTL
jgi:hypothetical protein